MSFGYFMWGIFPYISFLLLVGGLVYRYRFDQMGWTSRSSQMYESKILKIASPLFHFALLGVIIGHIVGLLIPESWTTAIGISPENYHKGALWLGVPLGVLCIAGFVMLIYRRRSNPSVFAATTWNDKIMFLILGLVMFAGLAATLMGSNRPGGGEHDYRETVSIWFRSLFVLQPDVAAMEAATPVFQWHVGIALVLFAILPFTRLVHAFTMPLHYMFRPYVVYRSRDGRPAGGRASWETIGSRKAR